MQFELTSSSKLNTSVQDISDNSEKLVQLLLGEDDGEDCSTHSGSYGITSSGSMENLAAN